MVMEMINRMPALENLSLGDLHRINGECFLFWDKAADCAALCKRLQGMNKKEK